MDRLCFQIIQLTHSHVNKGKIMSSISNKLRTVTTAALVAGCTLAAQHAGATVIATEFFNGYGNAEILNTLGGNELNGGTGWDNAWSYADEKYVPGSVSYAAAGYNNNANLSGPNDGALAYIGNRDGAFSTSIMVRDFTTTETTLWYSAVISIDETADRAMLWIKGVEGGWGNDFVGVIDNNIQMRYNNTNLTGAGAPTIGTHLLLAKAELNVSGANDRLSFWFNPDLSGGEGGLGAATYTDASADTFGTAFGGVGVMLVDRNFDGNVFTTDPDNELENGELIDAIRVGTTFADVTSVPEPGSLALLGLGGLLVARRRRQSS